MMRQTLVTGATSGVGRALVVQLMVTDGLLAVGRNEEELDALARLNGNIPPVRCDLAQPASPLEIVANRQVDVLINNAGVVPVRGTLADLRVHAIDAMIDMNLRAVMHLTQAVLAGMRARGRGHVVF